METKTRYIGKKVPKIDAEAKVKGARYGHDIVLPGMLHAKILRSAHPHARIVEVDVKRARKLPGVHAVLTAADIEVDAA